MRIAYLRRSDGQTDRGTSALVELRFAAKKCILFQHTWLWQRPWCVGDRLQGKDILGTEMRCFRLFFSLMSGQLYPPWPGSDWSTASPSPRRCWPRSGAGSRSCCSLTWCRRSWWGSSAWSPRHCPSGPCSCSYQRREWAPASSAASCFSGPPYTPRGLPVFLVWSHCTRCWTSSYNGEFSVSVRNALSCNKYQLQTVSWHAPSILYAVTSR